MVARSDILESIPFFGVLNEKEKSVLVKHMVHHIAPKYTLIYGRKEPAGHFYILAKGSIKTGTWHSHGREIIRQILHPRMIFGEQALIQANEPLDHFAVTLSPVNEYYSIRVQVFRQMMDANPHLAMSVLSLIGGYLRRTENQMASLILKDARSRVIDFILENAQLGGRRVGVETLLKHSLTQQDIANSTGTSRQTVTAVLNELRKSNKIYFNRNTILIRDIATLAAQP